MHRIIALTLIALVLAACSPSSPSTPASGSATGPTSQATRTVPSLRIAILNDESTLTPYTYRFGYPGLQMLYLVYDTLMVLDAENTPKPLLASDVKIGPDGTTYDLTLRTGVTWHDGKPLTADDVKFTFDYFLANPKGSFTTPLRQVATVTVTSPTALSIRLRDPNPSFPIRALATVPILPKHLWESVEGARVNDYAATVGSGPYKLVEANPNSAYRLQANTSYMLGAPTVTELIFPIIRDQNTAFQALRSGEVQAITRETPAELVNQFNSGPFKVAKGPGFASTLLQFNLERAPLDRREVRQAIDYAIDKRMLVQTLLLNLGTAATPGFVHPDSPYHDPAVNLRYDPNRAKSLLDGIGARPGSDGTRVLDGRPLSFTLLVYSNNPTRIRAAELISGMLKEVGITATVRAMDADSVDALVWPDFDVAKGRNFDMAIWGWSAPVQVDIGRLVDLVHSDVRIGTSNIGGFKSAEADRLADQLRTTADESTRKRLAQSIEQLIATELPFVMLYFADGAYAYRADAYDGWVYQKGQGIFTRLSFVPAMNR
ncbi:MAG: peptide ABC transporter substrate-binding protein [Dehalococcoidia bacterium]|nr:MAG: peptide ABC transporter substrate-binding protein [Dehalococcoidia bacterium]